MIPEHVLVPYSLCELPPGPWVVFAPHADDETFGMGGALRKAHQAGLVTHVVVMTDGALGRPAAADSEAAQAVVEIRESEVRTACNLLGVASVTTLGQPDRGLLLTDSLIERLMAQIADLAAGTVFFPAILELHPDHRATAQLVWAAMQRLQQRPWRQHLPQLWSYEISVQSPVNRLMDITAEMAVKQQAMDVYVSQNGLNNYPELILGLNKARTFSLPSTVQYAEGFYQFPLAQLSGTLQQAAKCAWDRYWEDGADANQTVHLSV
jgi:LmbE family N-acetylglucosaminyl deacetylase